MILSRRNIEFVLTAEVDRAKAAFDIAREKAIAAGNLQARPIPAGPTGCETLETPYRIAMDAYASALREFNHFVILGIVPDRLKEQEPKYFSASAQEA